jgi:hypothetical protein
VTSPVWPRCAFGSTGLDVIRPKTRRSTRVSSDSTGRRDRNTRLLASPPLSLLPRAPRRVGAAAATAPLRSLAALPVSRRQRAGVPPPRPPPTLPPCPPPTYPRCPFFLARVRQRRWQWRRRRLPVATPTPPRFGSSRCISPSSRPLSFF